jgi:DNA-binding CsgD family transcriptional regulator
MTTNTGRKKLDLAKQIVNFKLSNIAKSKSYISIIVLVFSIWFFTEDLYVDVVVEGQPLTHLLLEGGVFFSIVLVLIFEIGQVLKLSSKVSDNDQQIHQLKKHLSDVIRDEFKRWKLTETEQEIALMLIKGLSMQEIGALRGVKEKSVRHRATAIYAKANVANRYELTSYFIEDLLAPDNTS